MCTVGSALFLKAAFFFSLPDMIDVNIENQIDSSPHSFRRWGSQGVTSPGSKSRMESVGKETYDDEEEEEDEIEGSNWNWRNWKLVFSLRFILSVVGTVLIIVGVSLNSVLGKQLIILGIFFIGALASVLTIIGISLLCEYYLTQVHKRWLRRGASMFLFYWEGCQIPIRFALWSLIGLIDLVVGYPDKSDSVYFHSTRILGILLIAMVFRTLAVCARIKISQEFNARSHRTRMLQSVLWERFLGALFPKVVNPYFVVLYERLLTDGNDVRVMQSFTRYVNTHQIDGKPLPDGRKHCSSDLSEKGGLAAPRLFAKAVFERLYTLSEGARMLIGNNSTLKRTGSGSNLVVDHSTVNSEDSTTFSVLNLDYGDSLKGNMRKKTSNLLRAFGKSSTTLKAKNKAAVKRKKDKRSISKAEFLQCCENIFEDKFSGESVWDLIDAKNIGATNGTMFFRKVCEAFMDRKNLSVSLQDSRQVLHSIDAFLNIVIFFIVALFGMTIYRVDVLQLWLGVSSILLAFTFIFGGSAKTAFDSMVFLFLVHPYDVGDAIQLGPEMTYYVVHRIFLTSTELIRWDGAKTRMENRHMQDIVPIHNLSTSASHGTVQKFAVDMRCVTTTLLDSLRYAITAYTKNKPDRFTGDFIVNARELIDPLKCSIVIWVELSYPSISLTKTNGDISELTIELLNCLNNHELTYSGTGSGLVQNQITNASQFMNHQSGTKISTQAETTEAE